MFQLLSASPSPRPRVDAHPRGAWFLPRRLFLPPLLFPPPPLRYTKIRYLFPESGIFINSTIPATAIIRNRQEDNRQHMRHEALYVV